MREAQASIKERRFTNRRLKTTADWGPPLLEAPGDFKANREKPTSRLLFTLVEIS
jgi:hypothetical protein